MAVPEYDVIVIGGGLAGCSASLQLARRGYRVLLLEKQRYPAHKLCGEFLSVEVQDLFERLGVREEVLAAGAHPMTEVSITTHTGNCFESALPGTALGLSRYALDRLLAHAVQVAGATVRDGVWVRNVEGSLGDGFTVATAEEHWTARFVLGAFGKRSLLDRSLERPFLDLRSPFVAFKAHFEGPDLGEVIELHSFPGGYCGLSHVERRMINACWIAHEDTLKTSGSPDAMIDQTLRQNATLARRFDTMSRISNSFLAVSQVQFHPKGAWAGDVCMIGDTAGMIAPMCGDGMAMALRSAEMAVPLVVSYLDGGESAATLKQQHEAAWRSEFGTRMRLGRWLHHAYCRPALARVGVEACRRMPPLGRWLIRKTRG
jgi:flavin-dependent dehydrogenase